MQLPTPKVIAVVQERCTVELLVVDEGAVGALLVRDAVPFRCGLNSSVLA